MPRDDGHSSPTASDWQPTSGSYDAETNTVTLSGEWDFSLRDRLRELIDKLRASYASIDLVDTTFIDSSVLNEIVRAHNRLSACNGRLRIFVGEGHVARLLKITGLDRVLEVGRKP